MRAIYLAAALLLSGFAFAAVPAAAAPAAPMQSQAVPSGLQLDLAQYYRGDDRRDRPRYRAGHHYRSAPHGWRRYDRRPRDWNRRGCIMVGPLWFCQ